MKGDKSFGPELPGRRRTHTRVQLFVKIAIKTRIVRLIRRGIILFALLKKIQIREDGWNYNSDPDDDQVLRHSLFCYNWTKNKNSRTERLGVGQEGEFF